MQKDKQIVVISGASRGLGFHLAQSFSEQYEVIGFARNPPKTEHSFQFHAGVDVTDPDSLLKLSKSIDYKRLWGVIVNAGTASMNHFTTMPIETRHRIVDLNFHGAANLIEIFGKKLIRRRAGRIIAVSTVAVPLLLEGEAVYAASKAALEVYVKIVAKELGAWGVTANLVAPGPIETDLIAGLTIDQKQSLLARLTLKNYTTLEDVEVACKYFLSDESRQVTGQLLTMGHVG